MLQSAGNIQWPKAYSTSKGDAHKRVFTLIENLEEQFLKKKKKKLRAVCFFLISLSCYYFPPYLNMSRVAFLFQFEKENLSRSFNVQSTSIILILLGCSWKIVQPKEHYKPKTARSHGEINTVPVKQVVCFTSDAGIHFSDVNPCSLRWKWSADLFHPSKNHQKF